MHKPTKVDPVGKELIHTHKVVTCEFDFHCRCEGLVGRQSVSTSVSAQRALRPALTLVNLRPN